MAEDVFDMFAYRLWTNEQQQIFFDFQKINFALPKRTCLLLWHKFRFRNTYCERDNAIKIIVIIRAACLQHCVLWSIHAHVDFVHLGQSFAWVLLQDGRRIYCDFLRTARTNERQTKTFSSCKKSVWRRWHAHISKIIQIRRGVEKWYIESKHLAA